MVGITPRRLGTWLLPLLLPVPAAHAFVHPVTAGTDGHVLRVTAENAGRQGEGAALLATLAVDVEPGREDLVHVDCGAAATAQVGTGESTVLTCSYGVGEGDGACQDVELTARLQAAPAGGDDGEDCLLALPDAGYEETVTLRILPADHQDDDEPPRAEVQATVEDRAGRVRPAEIVGEDCPELDGAVTVTVEVEDRYLNPNLVSLGEEWRDAGWQVQESYPADCDDASPATLTATRTFRDPGDQDIDVSVPGLDDPLRSCFSIPPGSDVERRRHPDDFEGVAGHGPGRPLPLDQARIGVLENGFYRSTAALLGRLSDEYTFVPVGFDPALADDVPLLVVPSGGLNGLGGVTGFRRTLAQYVERGGTVLVFAQAFGRDWEALPDPLRGIGWEQDQGCFLEAGYARQGHAVLAGQRDARIDVATDGYFQVWGAEDQPLLERSVSGLPFLLEVPRGDGRVLASTLFTDWNLTHRALTTDEEGLAADLVTWGLAGGHVLTEVARADFISIPMAVQNPFAEPAERLALVVRGQDREVVDSLDLQGPFLTDEPRDVVYEHPGLPFAGLYRLEGTFVDPDGLEVGEPCLLGAFAIRGFSVGDVPPSVHVSIVTEAERLPVHTPVPAEVHVRNRTGGPTTLRVRCDPGGLDRTEPFEADEARVYPVQAPGGTFQVVFRASAESEPRAYQASARKVVNLVAPTLRLELQTDEQVYLPGSTITVAAAVSNEQPLPLAPELVLQLLGVDGQELVERRVPLQIAGDAREERAVELTIPEDVWPGLLRARGKVELEGHPQAVAEVTVSVPQFRLVTSAAIVGQEPGGDVELELTLANNEDVALVDGVLNHELRAPSGEVIDADGIELGGIASGEALEVPLTLHLGALTRGTYRLDYTVEGVGQSFRGQFSFRVGVDLVARSDEPSYVEGDPFVIELAIRNTGDLSWAGSASVTSTLLPEEEVRDVELDPETDTTLAVEGRIPEGVDPGVHEVAVALRVGDSVLERTLQVRIPMPRVTFEEPARTWRPGDVLELTATSSGGVSFEGDATIRVRGPGGYAAEASLPLDLPARTSGTLELPLPGELASGEYLLDVTLVDRRVGQLVASLVRWIDIVGTDVVLSTETRLHVHLAGDTIGTTTRVEVGDAALEQATLVLRIVPAVPPEAEPFAMRVHDAIQQGLRWLRLNQDGNGGWPGGPNSEWNGGLPVLAFLEEPAFPGWSAPSLGYAGLRGSNRSAVERAVRYLVRVKLRDPDDALVVGYGAALMGLSAYLATGGPDADWGIGATVRETLHDALEHLRSGMNPSGTWCYYGRGCEDSSVTWFAAAGLAAGATFFEEAAADLPTVAGWYQETNRNDDGGSGNRVGLPSSPPQSAVALFVRLLGGVERSEERLQAGVGYLRDSYDYLGEETGWDYLTYLWALSRGLSGLGRDLGPDLLSAADVGGVRDPTADGYPEAPAGWRYDLAWRLLELQDDEGLFVNPNGTDNPTADHAFALLVLERSVGGVCFDSDHDGVCEVFDNCPETPNPGQTDIDQDRVGDACEDTRAAWEEEVPVAVEAGEAVTVERDVAVDLLGATGRMSLAAEVRSTEGQVLAAAAQEFWVAEGGLIVTVATDRPAYRSGEQVTISGTVENHTGQRLEGVELRVRKENGRRQTLLSETLDLEPAAVHPFEVQTEAQSRFRVVASAADEGASLEVPVTVTSIRHTVFVPGEGGLDPVVARVTLINQGKDADQVSVTFAVPGQEARRIDVVVPPGSARQVEEPFEIREDTLLQVDIEGALEAHEEHLVRFVRSLVVRMAPDPVQPEGLVAVPVLVDNRGRGDQPVQARVEVFRTDPDNEDGEVFVEGADIDLQAPGGVTSEATALFRLPAGTYRVRLQAPPDEQQAWVAVQPAAAVRLSAEVLPPEAGQVAVHVHTHNWGQLGLAGRLRVEGAGGASSKEVELPARAAETHTLPILPAVDGPGTYPVTVRLTSGGEELARAETVLDLVGPRVVLRAGPEPSPLELFAGGVGQVEFELANDGDLPGWAVLSARLGDLGEAESRLWLEPAAQQHLVLPISVPPDYPSGEVRGTFSLAGGAGELRVIVRGADLEVDAALDAPAYDPGDTARLAITVRSVGDADLDLRCVLPAGGAQEEHAFRLDAPGEHTCWFEIPVGEEGDRLLPFGVYHASGRAVHLGSVMLRSLAGALVVSTDRPSYGPGDTVRGVVQAARPGRVEVLSPFGQELALDVDAQAAFELRVPDDVMTGLHAIRLDYAGEEFTYDLVVLGLSVEVREVVPDRSRYGGQDELVAEVTLHSNAERDVLLVATHQDPAGDTAELDTVEHRLLDGRSTARLSGWLATTLAGAHRLQVTVHLVGEAPPGADGAEQPGQVLASEETSFEVGRFRLVALRPRREVFLVGEDVEVSAEVWIDVADVGGGPPLELLHVVDGAAGDRILIGEDGFETVAMPVGRLEYGSHRLVAWLTDGDVSSPLEILVRVGDGTPPRTTLRVEGPQHEDFVAPSTRFVLEAEDEASGVAATEYAVDAAALAPYEGPFGVEGHGPHTLRYRSVDVAGNAELVREEVVVLDERPPQVVLQVGPPSHPLDEGHLVAPESAIDVEAADEGEHDSGLASAAVRLDEQEWTEPPLALAGLADGPYRVEVRAEDRVENTAEAAGTLVVDSQPPAISLTPDRDTQAVGPVAVAFRVEDGGDPAPLVESTLESGTELVVDGLYELRVRAEDHLDHAAEAAVHVGLETPPCGERGAGCPAGADCNPSGHCEVGDGFDVEVALPAAVVVLGVDASRAEEVCALCDTEAAGEAACRPEEVRAGEAPRRRVQLPAFLMDRTEVTNAQHRACVEAGACPAVAAVPGLPEGYAQDPAYADHPVLGASREAAAAYCAWLGKRLPTPDEWERAAAGLVGRPWPWGGEPPEGQAGEAGPAAAAAEEPGSIYGLLGLAGNAEEWACDAGECRLRGGSWQSTTPCDLRTTRRAPAPGAGDEARRAGVGLRCVRPDCELADPACVEAASAAPGPGAPFGDAGPDTGWEPDPDAGTPGEGEGEGEGGGEGCECGLGGGGAGLPALVVLLGLLVTAWRRGRRRSGARGRLAGLGVAILATLASGDVGAQDLGTRSFRLVQVELGSVTFKSDHRKLRNAEGSLLSVGTPFGKPEWQAGRPWREGEPESAYPVTHSGSSSVELDVHLRLHPPEAAGGVEVTLRGDGPDLGGGDGPLRPLDFSARAALSASAPRVSLTADTDLPSDVTALEDQDVVWTLELPDEVECRLGSTRHDVYVTLDEPVRIEDQPTEVSLARIREITAFVDGAETETDVADRLVTEIHGRVPFGGNHCPVNPWVVYQMVLDSEPLAYDCLAQAAFMQVAAAVVGVPSEVGFVYATSGPGRYSTRADAWETHPDHDDWILTYTIPGARGSPLGNLWESVCRVGGRDYAVSEGVSCTSPFDVICYIIGDGTSNQQRWARPSEHGSWELIEGEDPVPLPGCPDEPDCR